MDLKPLYIVVATLAVGAGVVMGWLDAQKARPEAASSGGAQAISPLELLGAEARRPRRDQPATFRPAFPSAAEGPALPEESSPAVSSPAGSQVSPLASGLPAPTSEESAALRKIEAAIEAQEFATAAAEARRLRETSETLALREAARLEAKATIFADLVPEASGSSPALYEVLLANRNRITATDVEEEPDRYRLTLPGGITYLALREDVLKIEKNDPKAFIDEKRREIRGAVEKLEDPLEIYEQGVKRYYELGLRAEGYRLLEKLLSMPGSEEVARRAGGDAEGEDAVRLWRIAAGRPDAGGLAEAPRAAADPASPPAAPDIPAEVSAEGFAELLGQVQRHLGAAEAIYENALGKEGRERELRIAYGELRKAQSILDLLPENTETLRLRREVSRLLVDVSKSLPFGG